MAVKSTSKYFLKLTRILEKRRTEGTLKVDLRSNIEIIEQFVTTVCSSRKYIENYATESGLREIHELFYIQSFYTGTGAGYLVGSQLGGFSSVIQL